MTTPETHWLTFVGEGRSGHTILSAILGSHPNARISEEQKYISKWNQGSDEWSRGRTLHHLMNSGLGGERARLGLKGILEHEEPLLLVGDKCGWDAVNEIRKRGAPSNLISQFGDHMGLPVKTIVSLRNPLDNIANWVLSPKYARMYPDEEQRATIMIRRYRRFHNAAVDVLEGQDTFFLYNDELISNPEETIISLAAWAGLPAHLAWVKTCASGVFREPNESRKNVNWSPENLERVTQMIESNPLLERYR
tara:strand:+ start:2443 stop:3195 length:753 start_codon:yes stop_codon:yes gene_type:complete